MTDDTLQANSSTAAAVPGQQLGVGREKDAGKPRASAYTSLNDLRRIFDLPPIALPSTMPDADDPTNDLEVVSPSVCGAVSQARSLRAFLESQALKSSCIC